MFRNVTILTEGILHQIFLQGEFVYFVLAAVFVGSLYDYIHNQTWKNLFLWNCF